MPQGEAGGAALPDAGTGHVLGGREPAHSLITPLKMARTQKLASRLLLEFSL